MLLYSRFFMLCWIVFILLPLLLSRYVFPEDSWIEKSDPSYQSLMPLSGHVVACSCAQTHSLSTLNCKYVYLLYLCFDVLINPFWVGVIMNALHAMERVGIWWLLTSLNLINCSIPFVQFCVLGVQSVGRCWEVQSEISVYIQQCSSCTQHMW